MAKKQTNTKNKNNTTVSVDELLARRGALEDFSKFYSEMFNTTFEIEKIKPSDITTIMEGDGDEYEKYGRLIYISCPYFRQKELQNKLGVENPYDVVEALYGDNYAEFYMFGNFILKRYGFTGDRLQRVKK